MARILLIEDSPTDTAVLTQLLERNGHQVLSSHSAEDGIEICKRELPDLVLMDVVLPGMNGFQATRALSRDSATSAIPVLIVSTKGMETDKAWGMRQGAQGLHRQAAGRRRLIARINELLGGLTMGRHRHTTSSRRRTRSVRDPRRLRAHAAWRTSPACPSSSTRRACGAASAIASASAGWPRVSTRWSRSCRCRRSRRCRARSRGCSASPTSAATCCRSSTSSSSSKANARCCTKASAC